MLTLFVTVALAHLLAVMSPGPDFAMVTRQTLAQGRAAGIWTALGIASGLTFHIGWGMFGLGWVIERWPALLDTLRWAGAIFLLYMGAQALRAQPVAPLDNIATAPATARGRHFAIGLATNLLNPKVLMFFVALCSAVITRDTPMLLRVALGAWMIASTAAWFCLVSVSLGHPRIRARLQANAHWIDRGMGAILLILGLGMLLSGLRS